MISAGPKEVGISISTIMNAERITVLIPDSFLASIE